MQKPTSPTPAPSELLRRSFPFQPTKGQANFFVKMDDFFQKPSEDKPVFILKGYAGTGKTSLLSAVVKILPHLDLRALLLAPTGRAAKVMSTYSGRSAFTIHKIIYKPKGDAGTLGGGFTLQKNYFKDTLFVVDESSMLADDGGMSGNLLWDLITYTFSGVGNRLLFVGDTAQLPPVGSQYSPALDAEYLLRHYRLDADQIELVEVMRQKLESGILFNATILRQELGAEQPAIKIQTHLFKDIFKMTSEKLEDGLRYAYSKYGTENTCIITRSNK